MYVLDTYKIKSDEKTKGFYSINLIFPNAFFPFSSTHSQI